MMTGIKASTSSWTCCNTTGTVQYFADELRSNCCWTNDDEESMKLSFCG